MYHQTFIVALICVCYGLSEAGHANEAVTPVIQMETNSSETSPAVASQVTDKGQPSFHIDWDEASSVVINRSEDCSTSSHHTSHSALDNLFPVISAGKNKASKHTGHSSSDISHLPFGNLPPMGLPTLHKPPKKLIKVEMPPAPTIPEMVFVEVPMPKAKPIKVPVFPTVQYKEVDLPTMAPMKIPLFSVPPIPKMVLPTVAPFKMPVLPTLPPFKFPKVKLPAKKPPQPIPMVPVPHTVMVPMHYMVYVPAPCPCRQPPCPCTQDLSSCPCIPSSSLPVHH